MDFPIRPVLCEILVVLALRLPRQPLAADNLPAKGTALSQQAIASYQQGRDSGAEALFKRGPGVCEKELGPVHANIATSRNNRLCCTRPLGRNAVAGPLYKPAVAIRENPLGPDSVRYAPTLIRTIFRLINHTCATWSTLPERLGFLLSNGDVPAGPHSFKNSNG
jgi:hypothetical protein